MDWGSCRALPNSKPQPSEGMLGLWWATISSGISRGTQIMRNAREQQGSNCVSLKRGDTLGPAWLIERENGQASPAANGFRQGSQFLRAQPCGKRFRRWARDRVGVDFFDLSAATHDLIQAVAVSVQFFAWHHFAADFEKQTLNDDRPDSSGLHEVFQNAIEAKRRQVHHLEISFRAGVEFAPEFTVVGVHDFQAASHVGFV